MRGHRIHEAVSAKLVRIVDEDRHPGLHAWPDEHARTAHAPLGEGLVLRTELGDHRGDDRAVQGPEVEAVQRQQVRDRRGELIGGGAGNGAEAPVAPEFLPSKAPMWVWVFPMSTASSMSGIKQTTWIRRND